MLHSTKNAEMYVILHNGLIYVSQNTVFSFIFEIYLNVIMLYISFEIYSSQNILIFIIYFIVKCYTY